VGFAKGALEDLVSTPPMIAKPPYNKPKEFDAYDRTYSEAVDRALAFSGMRVDFFTRVKVDYLVDLIDRFRPPAAAAELIDIGCGVGNSHALLSGRVAKLAGVDVSSACIAQAAGRNPQNDYRAYDGLNLPYPDSNFDVASAVCVFHHIPIVQRIGLTREIRRALRAGGLFVIFEHNPINPLTRHVVSNCEFDAHAILLRSVEAESLLREAGFRQVDTRFILTVPAGTRTLRAVDQLFSRVPLGAQYFTVGLT
jgi:SAM-dependent methyltransferase